MSIYKLGFMHLAKLLSKMTIVWVTYGTKENLSSFITLDLGWNQVVKKPPDRPLIVTDDNDINSYNSLLLRVSERTKFYQQ